MLKKKSKFAMILTLILLCVPMLLSGCARFDKSAYVQAALDSIYKGDHLNFSEITGTDIAQLESNYTEAINTEMVSFLNYIGIGDYSDKVNADVKAELTRLLTQIYKHASYSVGAENTDGSVPVKILPIALSSVSGDEITAYMEDFFAKNDNGDFADLSDEEFYSQYVKGAVDIISKSLNAISYSNEITVHVSVVRSSGTYSIDDDSFAELDRHILDYTL